MELLLSGRLPHPHGASWAGASLVQGTERTWGAPGPALLFTEVQLHCRHTEAALKWAILRRLLPPLALPVPTPSPSIHTQILRCSAKGLGGSRRNIGPIIYPGCAFQNWPHFMPHWWEKWLGEEHRWSPRYRLGQVTWPL